MNLFDQYKQMHTEGAFKGFSLLPHVEDIANLVRKYDAKTLLDFGCGKGLQYTQATAHEAWGGIMPTLYDPHVEPLSAWPHDRYDGIICTDVLEHIDDSEQRIQEILWQLYDKARDFVFLTICTRPANKTLPDGRNCHLTVRPENWWLKEIETTLKRYMGWQSGPKNIWTMNSKFYVKFTE